MKRLLLAAASDTACLKICSCSGDSVEAGSVLSPLPARARGWAAAAAEIDFLELAAPARLRHPAGAAITVEGFGVLPDPGDRMVAAHRFEFESGNGFGGVAGQNLPRG